MDVGHNYINAAAEAVTIVIIIVIYIYMCFFFSFLREGGVENILSDFRLMGTAGV